MILTRGRLYANKAGEESMHRKHISARPLLIALALLLPGLLLPFTFLPISSATVLTEGDPVFSVQTHVLTAEEAAQMELIASSSGSGVNSNVIVDGHGTGLVLPNATEWSNMVGKVTVTDSVSSSGLRSSGYYDISTQSYFPAVGDQGGEGSCAAWAMTYYDYGYLEAKDNGWTDASTGNTAHLLSPAWTYNRVNGGVDSGTFMDTVANVIINSGVASLKNMPYTGSDLTSLGGQDAFREAPLHRAASVVVLPTTDMSADVTSIKNLISSNVPVTFAIDANQFNSGLNNDNLIVAAEYSSTSINHAQTIVGYNDTMSDGVHPDVGAFKVVNSWGKSWGNHGYYWISYDAFKKIGSNSFPTYIIDKPSYQPSLIGVVQFNVTPTRNSAITLGVGTVGGTDTYTPTIVLNGASVSSTYPTFMAFDLTSLLAKYQAGKTSFYLTLGTTNTAGSISSFRIEEYLNGYGNAATQVSGQSPDVPKINPGSVTVTLTPYATITPATALDNSVLTITGSGNVLWSPETRDYHTGTSAMQSGNIGNGGKSAVQVSVVGPTTASFWWKTSTQTTDVLRFYVDSINLANASGVTTWTQVSTSIASGTHTLKWEYSKDATIASNQDLVLLDQVSTTSGSTAPSAPTGLATTVGSSIQLSWSTPSSNGGYSLTSYSIYRGVSSGAESYLTSVPASSLVFTDSNASLNQTYYYQVSAVNSIGESARSNEASGKIPSSIPVTPTAMSAVAGPTYIDLSWSSTGANLTGFHLYRGTVANGETLFQTLGSSVRSYRDSTAVAGTTYYYRVDAYNDLLSSSPSSEASARIPIVPNAPITLVATISGSNIHLAWTAPLDNGGSAILGYKVYRGTATGGESGTPIGTVATTSYDDLSATAGTRYYYVVKAYNAVGDSIAGNEASGQVPTVPTAPTGLTAVVAGSYVHLSWTAPADNGGAAITQYNIYRGTSSGGESGTALGTSGTTAYDDSAAVIGTHYYYTLTAKNSVGVSAPSNEANSQIGQAPDAPSSLSASTTLGHDLLTWTIPASNGGSPITSYRVFRGATADPSAHTQIGTSTVTSYDDNQITVGQTYYYSVKAVNIVGASVASNVVSISVKGLPSTPNSLSTQMSDRTIVLTWSAPTSDGYSTISSYKIYRSGTSGSEASVATVTGTTYTDSNLINGNNYYYRVSALNTIGEGPQCAEVNDSPASVPSAPSINSVGYSLGAVDLTWSSLDNGGRTITGYSVYRGTSALFASASLLSSSVTGNTYQDDIVVVGAAYYYFVTATNSIGTSNPSVGSYILITAPPSAPQTVASVVVSGHVHLSWSAPASSGSSPVSGYCVYRSSTSGSEVSIAHLGNVLVYDDLAVTLGQTYYYLVSAENDFGVGPNSSEVHSLYALAPASPTNLTATGSIGTVSLSWSAPAQNGAPIYGYTISIWTSGTSATIAAQIGPDSTTSTLSSLSNGVQYWFSVSASNSAGAGPTSDSATCVIGSVPSAPTALGTTAGNGFITVTWGAPTSTGGISALSYHIWRSTTGTSTLIADLGTTVRSYSDTSVVPGTTYQYTLTASNAKGVGPAVGPSNIVAATLPGAPATVAVNYDSTSVLISWTLPTFDGGIGLTGFQVYRTDGTGWILLKSVTDPNVLSYKDNAVVAGVSYQYCVSALNSIGEGSKSNALASVSIASIPSSFIMTASAGNSNVTLKWTVPISVNTPLLGYTITRTETGSGSVRITTLDPTLIRYVDANVTAGLNYSYMMTATNAVGSSSTDLVTVHIVRSVILTVQIVPFSNSVAISGVVTDTHGLGIGDQKLTVYRSNGLAGIWTSVAQLTSSSSGKFSTLISTNSGIMRLRVALADDGTHIPMTIDRTVGSLLLRNGDMASITTSSNMSDGSLSGTEDMITFTMEQGGSANISIPKDAISDLGLIDVLIDGVQGNYQVTEAGDHYVFTLGNLKAGQIIAMSIGQPTTQDTIPILMGISLFLGACVGMMIFWRMRRR